MNRTRRPGERGQLDFQMRFAARLLTLGCLLLGILPAAAAAEARVALVIGNADYAQKPLTNPVNDARDLAATLEKLGFEVLLRTNRSGVEMKEDLAEFQDRLERGRGVGLFYFSGHGMQAGRGRNYLLPVGRSYQRERDVELFGVDAGAVLARMEEAGNALSIVILDACRDSPLPAESRSSASRGLGRMDAPRGSLIAFATAPGKVADDNTRGRNGLYTKHLLAAIATPGLRLEDVFKQVGREVERETNGRQSPEEIAKLRSAQPFYFMANVEVEPNDGGLGESIVGSMVRLGPGCFMMGSPNSEKGRSDDERQHWVCIEEVFELGKHEVTVGQFRRFVDSTGYQTDAERNAGNKIGCRTRDGSDNSWPWRPGRSWRFPGFDQGEDHPVVCVSWNDVQAYLDWLNGQGRGSYRLATEAEWEFAARAGTPTPFHTGQRIGTSQANFDGNYTYNDSAKGEYRQKTTPVGSFGANDWGLHDVHGNVWELTCSGFEERYDGGELRCAIGALRYAARGGSWGDFPRDARSGNRHRFGPTDRNDNLGFCIVRARH